CAEQVQWFIDRDVRGIVAGRHIHRVAGRSRINATLNVRRGSRWAGKAIGRDIDLTIFQPDEPEARRIDGVRDLVFDRKSLCERYAVAHNTVVASGCAVNDLAREGAARKLDVVAGLSREGGRVERIARKRRIGTADDQSRRTTADACTAGDS